MWLFDRQFLKSYSFDDKESDCIPNAILIEKAHKNAINGVSHRIINSRPAKKVYLKSSARRTGSTSLIPPQKISKAVVAYKERKAHKTTFIIIFAAKERIPKENVVFLGAAFFAYFFCRTQKK